MNILSSHNPSLRATFALSAKVSLSLIALMLTFATPSAEAQTTDGKITIGGKVYGGGKQGAIGINNVKSDLNLYPTNYSQDEADAANAKLDGAISADVALTAENYAKVNAVLGTSYAAGDKVTEPDKINQYNATLPGAITTSTKKPIAPEAVQLADNGENETVATVIVNQGEILAVFGGGEKGRTYGKTAVAIQGESAQIGLDKTALDYDTKFDAITPAANKLVCGNAFGAGDGEGADVFGGSHVTIKHGTINGSVYGGGNMADLVGSTELTLQGGKYVGAVFGGAKQADIWGHTYVNIDGANAQNDLHIIDVYGGNDIAGNIQPTTNANWSWATQAKLAIPVSLLSTGHLTKYPNGNVTNEWNAFIYASQPTNDKKILIDNLYGGGNGDYDYANDYPTKSKPVIGKTYMQIEGGMYGSVYGGGNAATVSGSTDICLYNSTEVNDAYRTYLATLAESSKSRYSTDYAFNRVFGGNNKEPMAIRPNWYLEKAWVNNLYSGGNAGPMTYYKTAATNTDKPQGGICIAVESADMTVHNVYGGCRMADVVPTGTFDPTKSIGEEEFLGTTFQTGYAARVLIKGGNIDNVYGGNDVSGIVYYGSQVEILSSVNGDVYGAGNGSYAYTDKTEWVAAHPEDADYYYDPTANGATSSVEALNNHRPNVEKSWVHVAGHGVGNPTVIGGSLYCGGNSATLRTTSGDLKTAKAHLQIGSDVIADQVFQGSNGVNMISKEMLQKYADSNFSSLNLTNTTKSYNEGTATEFDKYMEGVEVAIKPEVAFDEGYADHSARFGSLYCGGNVGSMSANGEFTINFLNSLIIYNKLVGGSNSANVKVQFDPDDPTKPLNTFHLGGLIGAAGTNGNKVVLNVAGLILEPRKLTRNIETGAFELNQFNYTDDSRTMLKGANIYGGCYDSGYINGNVRINISENTINFNGSGVLYDAIQNDVLASTLSVYGGGYGKETEIWGNTEINITDNGQIMKAYGGGEMGVVGILDRDDDGNIRTQTVNVWDYELVDQDICETTMQVPGFVKHDHTVAKFADGGTRSTTVTLNANLLEYPQLNAAKLYAGGFQGLVSGNTTLNLNQGRIYDGFGGASNADILGTAATYIGKGSAPQIIHNVYGANDFGGQIIGTKAYTVDNTPNEMETILTQAYVEYASGTIDGDLFGGPCGAYNYTDGGRLQAAASAEGFTKPQLLHDLLTSDEMLKPGSGVGYAANSFVNVTSTSILSTDVITGRWDDPDAAEPKRVGGIFGAGEGMKGLMGLADEAGSYVRLASAARSTDLATNVYGAGYCSFTNRSLVDAFTGRYNNLFGGCYGVKYQERIDNKATWSHELSYMGTRSAVRLYTMDNQNMDIYGAGANSGSKESGVVLHGGQARDVYGASLNEGITYAATVDVPATSNVRVNRIFGGAKGADDKYACDVYNAFINYKGTNARVNDAIYGGNNAYRMMRNTYMFIHVPVLNFENKLTDVFGGGLGPNTVSLYTEVNLENGGKVRNVYGGGKDGQVLDTPSFRHYMQHGERCDEGHGGKVYVNTDGDKVGYQRYLADYEVISFHDWVDARCSGNKDVNGAIIGSYKPNGFDATMSLYHLSTQQPGIKNTNVYIENGSIVTDNAYGGGLGEYAQVSGATNIQLHGGTVQGDIYGGGNAGPVREYEGAVKPDGATGIAELNSASTNVYLGGGSVRNVYGGGLGNTASVTGSTNVTMGVMDEGQNMYTTAHDERDYITIYAGDACVERSLYGGGQQGAVYGTANVTINEGHIGYKYDANVTINTTTREELKSEYAAIVAALAAETDAAKIAEYNARKAVLEGDAHYVENLDLDDADGAGKLLQNGNAFGAGYGEGATVDVTHVEMYGGTIRNSLYGGGEIAAVGQAVMKAENGANRELDHIDQAGRTHIYMYDGHVLNDVFGGGRGYSYNLQGSMIIGDRLYTSGYVFGTTDVNICGGEIGTVASVAEGHGNVFGGGNIGYCYSDADKKGTRTGSDPDDLKYQGRYYTDEYECNQCHKLMYATEDPFTCDFCKKSTADHETDPNFQTTFRKTRSEILSEDCRVIVSPYAKVLPGQSITLNGTTYTAGQFIPTDDLNYLADKNSDAQNWAKVSIAGVNIRNAVFAGGNVSAGSDQVYANATTVFGNATATLNDIFFRDLITIGTEHTGGLYGDGNLTFVDGYRELNISNYGTDYYGMSDHITIDEYHAMNDRERAYFELKYRCTNDHKYTPDGGTEVSYKTNQSISASDYDLFPDSEKANWEEAGFCSIYAGRLLNTIQRADFCGVFGSRMVLQGAQDRVPDVVDYTNYTINRVGELSLNKATFKGPQGELTDDVVNHGNYFGIYNIVNYLGALTSDVPFKSVRTYDNENAGEYAPESDGQTFYDWKVAHASDRSRNNGTSHNKVALASGVYLELVEEKGSTKENKNYGYITGVVQLDLINVMPGLGGGYVYAKNEHRASALADGATGLHENLSRYNAGAVNNSKYTYEGGADTQIETSGNFIHNVKQIIDDCYPTGGVHTEAAHYWFIKGEFYVYDQYISAYTGSSTAYTKDIKLPLTITAGAHGRLDLIDIKPNYYAYYYEKTASSSVKLGSSSATETVLVNNKTYALNDVITWWDYLQLSESDRAKFVPETYTSAIDFMETEGGTLIPAGSITFTPDEYNTYKTNHGTVWNPDTEESVPVDDVIRPSNVVSHEKGYVLTVDLDNPNVWDAYHSYQAGQGTPDKYDADAWEAITSPETKGQYISAPTYTPKTGESGVYGQRYYDVADIVTATIHDTYENLGSNKPAKGNPGDDNYQATVEAAYVAIAEAKYTIGTTNYVSQPGVTISQSDYNQIGAEQMKFEEAYVCTNTLELGANDFVFYGDRIPASRIDAIATSIKNAGSTSTVEEIKTDLLKNYFSKAYICTDAGLYGGQYYTAGTKYQALDSWASLSTSDRKHFEYVYDALDVLVDSEYSGTGEVGGMGAYKAPYSKTTPVDYEATWVGYTLDGSPTTQFTYNDITYTAGSGPVLTLGRDEYEALPNEQYHFAAFKKDDNTPDNIYIVSVKFVRGEVPYVVGKVISEEVYNTLDDGQKLNVQKVSTTSLENGTYYFCRDSYKVNEHGEGVAFTDINNGNHAVNSTVDVGTIINEAAYKSLPNKQRGFEVHGLSPTETSTLYVNRESDIYDLSKEKVITVIYQYEYEESDVSMTNIEKIMERHIINIHINFMSGVPTIGQLQPPALVLPGTSVGLEQPSVSRGAYEVLGSGWEIYTDREDADRHQNGAPYINYSTPMYWYQNDYWVAYYAKTYLGKTYSNPVQFKVANYHDMGDVMTHPDYMYIDKVDLTKSRPSKIYIDDEIHEVTPAVDETPAVNKSELDMFYDLYEETLKTKEVDKAVQMSNSNGLLYYELDGNNNPMREVDANGVPLHMTNNDTGYPVYTTVKETVYRLDEQVQGGKNLEFFLKADVAPEQYTTWEPIGTGKYQPVEDGKLTTGDAKKVDKPCFGGLFHGNGYTINGMTNSLFAKLGGHVYNLGVTGSFTKSGIADEAAACDGYVNSCWIFTTGTPEKNVLPIVGSANDLSQDLSQGAAGMRVFNSYYPLECGYDYGWTEETKNKYAYPRPLKSFNNGEVAFNLNGFYLNKRLADKTVTAGQVSNPPTAGQSKYKYYTQQSGGTLNAPTEGYYANGAIYEYGGQNYGYVERYFVDGDFIYSEGEIPEDDDERYNNGYYYPIWPDDYIFFGQMLTYGYLTDADYQQYQPMPSVINKASTRRLYQDEQSNQVYRVPAYYRSADLNRAFFNPNAVFADVVKDGAVPAAQEPMLSANKEIHKGLTALDFTDYKAKQYAISSNDADGYIYFPPMLDYTTLMGIQTFGITQNLLAYTPAPENTATTQTNTVITNYFGDPTYKEDDVDDLNYTDSKVYRRVAALNSSAISGIRGHVVQKNGAYKAHTDHFLVDKQDFNAPIAYSFDDSHRMWYQRKPLYAEVDHGWEGISIPFAAELVTTQDKGEITHFYKSSTDGYHPGYNSGHEYWLREFTGVIKTQGTAPDPTVTTANMTYPNQGTGYKDVQSTFLWDYYYNADGKDANGDDYRKDGNNEGVDADPSRNYYSGTRTYENYPLSEAGKPYIAGFPGARYYEFDLSGTFVPLNSGDITPQKLPAQTITFASNKGTSIAVSDVELADGWTNNTKGDNTTGQFAFAPNYLNVTAPVSTPEANYYVMNGEGSAFVKTETKTSVAAFRPYFSTEGVGHQLKAPKTRSIVFGMGDNTQFEPDKQTYENSMKSLNVRVKKNKIYVESLLPYTTTVRIVTAAGITVSVFDIDPGEQVETAADNAGVYLVNNKKVLVK